MKSIRQQLTLTILCGFGLLLIASGTAIYFCTRAALLTEFDAGLRARALAIMSVTEQGQDGIQFELPINLGNVVYPQYYEVRQTNGVVRAHAASWKEGELPNFSPATPEPAYWNLLLPGNIAGRAVGLKFTPKSEDENARRGAPQDAIVVVAADRSSLDQTLNVLAIILAATGLLTICVTVPMVKFSLRRGHAPLEQLAQQAATITADSLQTRFPVDSIPEELRPISARLNNLLGRLQESFERERRFSANLAHELRTPLAELRTHAEVELAWPEEKDSGRNRQTLDIALQMEAMVTRLLELTRSENGEIHLQAEPIPVAQFIDAVWQPLTAKAKEKQLAVSINVNQDAQFQTDPELFRSILINLISNAVEYTPPQGRIAIVWRSDASELTISNTVHDLKPDDVPHLFERLWRKDKSRTGTEHCGLGLALCREFAGLLHLSLTARFENETTFTVSLARQPADGGH